MKDIRLETLSHNQTIMWLLESVCFTFYKDLTLVLTVNDFYCVFYVGDVTSMFVLALYTVVQKIIKNLYLVLQCLVWLWMLCRMTVTQRLMWSSSLFFKKLWLRFGRLNYFGKFAQVSMQGFENIIIYNKIATYFLIQLLVYNQ